MPRTALIVAAVVLTLTGCSSTDGEVDSGEVAGSNRPAEETAASESETESEAESAVPEPAANPAFGETYTYEDGLSVTISAPQPYAPSDTASIGEPVPPAFVVFDITVVNGTAADYEPGLFSATMRSGNQESSQVFDSANGIGGTPSTVLLPGREAAFRMAFGATDPADLVLQVAPAFEYEAAIFTS